MMGMIETCIAYTFTTFRNNKHTFVTTHDRPSTQSKMAQNPILPPINEHILRQSLSSAHSDNQRGGIDDIRNFNYSFNPVTQSCHDLALIPSKTKIASYLEALIPITPESQLSLEVIHNINYKQVRKIVTGTYNFDSPQQLNVQKMKETMGRS